MSYSTYLLETARRLLGDTPGRPRHSSCNRAVSTAYYAVFDCFCRSVANQIVGLLTLGSDRTKTWVDVYRSIDHRRLRGHLLSQLKDKPIGQGLTNVQRLAIAFEKLQSARHEADYDPTVAFGKRAAQVLIDEAARAIHLLDQIPKAELVALIVGLVLDPKKR